MRLSLLRLDVVIQPIRRYYESTMARSLFVGDLRDVTRLGREVFVLLEKQLAQTRKGSLYFKAVLSDKTGRVETRYWDVPTRLYSLLEVGTGVQVDGTVTTYPPQSGELQMHIDEHYSMDNGFDSSRSLQHMSQLVVGDERLSENCPLSVSLL